MKEFLTPITLFLFIIGISACQNTSPSPKGISSNSSTTKAIDSKEPLTIIGGELSYELINTLQSNNKLYGVKFNPKNSTLIAYGDSSRINIYTMNLKLINTIQSKNDEINNIDISSDGEYLVCAGDDGYIEIWNLNNYKLIHQMQSNSKETFAVAFSSDGKKVASGGAEEVIDVWNATSGEQIARLEGHQEEISNISFIDFDRKLVSTAKDKQTKIWDVTKKRNIYTYLTPSNEYGSIKKVKSFDDYSISALIEVDSSEGNSRKRNGPPVWKYTIKFKDNQGNTLQEFNQHRGTVTDISVAKNRSYMASSSEDKTVRLWDLEKKKHITNIVLKDKAYGVAINKSGHLLVALEGHNKIKLFQIKSGFSPTNNSSATSPVAPSSTHNSISSWYKKQYAIVVGINNYKKKSIPTLSNALNDARSVAEILRKKGFSVIELYNENATKDRILDALKKIKQVSTAQDSSLFYFAGHGDGVSGENNVREGYILPFDFASELNTPTLDVMYYDKSALSISSLVMYSRDTKAKHIGIILDSCFSGLAMDSKYASKSLASVKDLDTIEFDTKTRSVRIKPMKVTSSSTPNNKSKVDNLFKELLSKKSINILTAGDDQPVSDGSHHSPFTTALLDVLDSNINKEGFIRFNTLANYIKNYVEKQTKQQQKPQYKNESLENGDFIFKL
jgi:WD40 repeat protein